MKKRFTIIAIVFLVSLPTIWADETPVILSSIDTELKNDYAITSLSNYYVTGIGAGLQAGFSLNFVENLGFFTSVDYFYGISKTIWVDSFQDLSLLLGVSYILLPDGEVSIVPEVGYGVCGHLLPGDVDRDGVEAVSFYLDQMLSLSVKFIYSIDQRFSIFFSPEMILFLESENNAILAGYNLGARINL